VATYTDGIISYEKTDFTDGSVSEDWYKNGIKTKHIYTFKSGAYWYETYDKNGNLKTKSYFFEDGTEKKYN